MKLLMASTVVTACLFLAAGCGEDTSTSSTAKATASATSDVTVRNSASGGEGTSGEVAVKITDSRDGGNMQFEYSWPAAVGAIPALAKQLKEERESELATLREEWETALADSPSDCVACRGRSFLKDWQVVTDLPRFLSLSATVNFYSGGAHGMQVFDALVWDREAGAAIEPETMFVSEAALDGAVRTRFCDALDKERAKRRGGPVERSDEWPNDCIDPAANSAVILGSKGGEKFDRVGFLVPPYNAGSYAEGSYDVTVPVDAAVLRAVKPEYRDHFAAME